MDPIFHYPPELMNLLIDTIPLLCPSKKDVLLFFQGAGVGRALTGDLAGRVRTDPDTITKYEIARTVLTRLNEHGDRTLRERREILKRVTEFEDFSTCWPRDQLKAKGLVAEVRRVVDVKDSFSRMRQEREAERMKHQAEQLDQLAQVQRRRDELAAIRRDLYSLFGEQDAQRRGRSLEGVLGRLFRMADILVRESFAIKGKDAEGVVEQIDGVVAIDGEYYLVEMKWWDQPLGTGDVAQHLVRVFNRGQARGILISASGYTEPALAVCRESLTRAVVVLCKLEEVVKLLEQEADLKQFLRQKIEAAIIHKNPLYEPLG
jgi:hypothetical protein